MQGERKEAGKTGPDGPLYWVSRKAARRAVVALHIAAILVIVLELLHPFDSDGYGVSRVQMLEFPGSYAVYGFVACVILVLLGRILRRLVMRSENYYGDDT